MLKNYFKIAWINLLKNKTSSFINISGLAAGITITILIALWVYDELSFNKNFNNYNQIARVMWHTTSNGERNSYPYNPHIMGTELRNNYSNDLKSIVMSTFPQKSVLTYSEKKISKTGTYMEAGSLDMFNIELLKGTRFALNDHASIILSASAAKILFGNSDPMNKVLIIDNKENVKVTGVYQDFPDNSDFKDITFIAPWGLYLKLNPPIKNDLSWDNNNFQVFVQVNRYADMNKVAAKIKNIRATRMPKKSVDLMKPEVFLHPMNKWHLYADFKNGVNAGGRIQFVWLFGMIGLFVLLLACINYMNLSTARSEKRAKEVGIRKTIGALRSQLMSQFFTESLVSVAVAFVISLLMVLLALPFFNEIADKKITIPWGNAWFWLLSMGFVVVTALIAGLYPALYLPSFQPIKVLKGTFRIGRFAVLPRKVLVVLQFTVSVILVIGTIVVFKQIQFAKNRSIGYNRNGLITMDMTSDVEKNFRIIREELKASGTVEEMATSANSTIDYNVDVTDLNWKGKDPGLSVDIPFNNVSYEYGKTIGWQIKEGRDFSPSFSTDSSAFILNESAVKAMDLQHPIGETIQFYGRPFTVIGVVKDIVFESPYKPAKESIYNMMGQPNFVVTIKFNPKTGIKDALDKIESVFSKYNPAFPFTYKFVDEQYARKFMDEVRIGKLAGYFAFFAIFISCLGLFGLASFMAEQRTKEIGVRKVLGASVFNLWRLLSKEFVMLIIISLFIAIPLGFYFMHNWLQGYQYRTEISWWIFAAAGIGALVITLLTVSFQAIKAAISNPVKSLRTE